MKFFNHLLKKIFSNYCLIFTTFFLEMIARSGDCSILIEGRVVDKNGTPIPDAAIALENSKIASTSASDGTFTLLSSNLSENLFKKNQEVLHFKNNRLYCRINKPTVIKIDAFTLQGCSIESIEKELPSGVHSMALPSASNGVLLCKITLNEHDYFVKNTIVSEELVVSEPLLNDCRSRWTGERNSSNIDILNVKQVGFINYRRNVTLSNKEKVTVTLITCDDTVKDADGNVYQAVKIGKQIWTTENFRSTKYRDGTPIHEEPSFQTWGMWTTGQFCYYENKNDLTSRKKYGALYNWYAVNETKQLAPAGWHVPSDSDWIELQNYCIANKYNYDGTAIDNKIAKSLAAMTDWGPSINAGSIGNGVTQNNATGFSALPAGYRQGNSCLYSNLYSTACWWSSTRKSDGVWSFYLTSGGESFNSSTDALNYGYSVRLVRDK
jgi:uncharacterized protein (TIGR02145 family)